MLQVPQQQLFNQSFSGIHTDSTINVKHHFSQLPHNRSQQLKYTWRRTYGDMVSLSFNNWHQYFCSPLDWNALIQVEIQHNGTLIQKNVYGPILVQEKIQQNPKSSHYRVWLSINDTLPKESELIIKNSPTTLFTIKVGRQELDFDRGFMDHRGWDRLNCLPDSGILVIQTKFFKEKWNSFLKKLNLQKGFRQNQTKDSFSVVFRDRIERDIFLTRTIEEADEVKRNQSIRHLTTESSQHRIFRQNSNQFQPTAPHPTKNINMQQSLIQIIDADGLGNKTMQDLYDLIYTPNHSHENSPQRVNYKTNIPEQEEYEEGRYSKSTIRQSKSNRALLRSQYATKTQTKQKFHTKKIGPHKQSYEKRAGKKLRSVHFKNPEEYELPNQRSPKIWDSVDPEIIDYLNNPTKIKELLRLVQHLRTENNHLNVQLQHFYHEKLLETEKNVTQNEIHSLKGLILKMTDRIAHLQTKMSQDLEVVENRNSKIKPTESRTPQFIKNIGLNTKKSAIFTKRPNHSSRDIERLRTTNSNAMLNERHSPIKLSKPFNGTSHPEISKFCEKSLLKRQESTFQKQTKSPGKYGRNGYYGRVQ